jgi:hypothetical protein
MGRSGGITVRPQTNSPFHSICPHILFYSPLSLWSVFYIEKFHRETLSRYPNAIDAIRSRVEILESKFVQMERAVSDEVQSTNGVAKAGKEVTARCFSMAAELVSGLSSDVLASAPRVSTPIAYAYQWNTWNQKSKLSARMQYSTLGVLSVVALIGAVSFAAFKASKSLNRP